MEGHIGDADGRPKGLPLHRIALGGADLVVWARQSRPRLELPHAVVVVVEDAASGRSESALAALLPVANV